ncbi:MAG: hypothetical protein NT137_00815 [Methanomassiliicoccales archaeon]|nr:hypothetical protein [Methanomassiliicoccales archaeon]
MRATFVNCLIERARKDERIFLITPDMGFSVLEKFRDEFPDRFLNVGVAEQNAIGIAAGLALTGKVVYVYSIIPFLTMRCYEHIRLDVAYMNLNVRLVGVGAGLTYGPSGPTHHSIEDIAIMRALPNMTVCCPGDPIEVRELINHSFDLEGPIYFRLGKSGEKTVHPEGTKIRIGEAIEVRDGKDLCLITTSNTLAWAVELSQALAKKGVATGVISMPTIKPLDAKAITSIVEKGTPIVTLEEHNIIGGLGSAVAEVIAEHGQRTRFMRKGIPDRFVSQIGDQAYLRKVLHIADVDELVRFAQGT